MLEIRCSGTPHEIGVTHGVQAKTQIEGSIAFYGKLFRDSSSMEWPEVVQEATRYVAPLEELAPRYMAEIRGIAAGAGLPFLDVVALNVRTEIAFGLFTDTSRDAPPSDGCTSLGWLTTASPSSSSSPRCFLAQNWDWMVEQAANLVVVHVSQPDRPAFAMVTEAGLIGKIGLNAAGVGCCLNAVRCRGVDPTRLPIHFALRACLEAGSRREAVEAIRKAGGVAGSGHILVADAATGPTGLECTHRWVRELPMDEAGRVCHSNHLLLRRCAGDDDVDEPPWLDDSPDRLARVRELTAALAAEAAEPSVEAVLGVLSDTQGFPASINRRQEGGSNAETLFTIVMDLTDRSAQVTFGRPTEVRDRVVLAF
ncbi:acyl-coenzyme A:6-aminopenicillanic acid acyl-transferase-domain-containing protein [Xylariaceae sp. FL0804]|nr:acyl-coenzyme A:6-aminopenicillanic acid acyl-transferase-domain-containing protein [Xylariaceae sp. FL0804]